VFRWMNADVVVHEDAVNDTLRPKNEFVLPALKRLGTHSEDLGPQSLDVVPGGLAVAPVGDERQWLEPTTCVVDDIEGGGDTLHQIGTG